MQSMTSMDYGDLPPLPPCEDGDEEAWMQERFLILRVSGFGLVLVCILLVPGLETLN